MDNVVDKKHEITVDAIPASESLRLLIRNMQLNVDNAILRDMREKHIPDGFVYDNVRNEYVRRLSPVKAKVIGKKEEGGK